MKNNRSTFIISLIFILQSFVFSTTLKADDIIAEELPLFEQHYNGVLGTSLDISIYSSTIEQARVAAVNTLTEIHRLEQIFSTYNNDSELMRINTERNGQHVSTELIDVIAHCDYWYTASKGKFSCRLGQVLELWNQAEITQIVPSRIEVRHLARKANQAEISLFNEQANSISLGKNISLDPSGLAKGYIIDYALTLLRQAVPEAIAIKVDIGGDAVYWGSPPQQAGWQVGIANPLNIADNEGFIGTLLLNSMAVAASGHSSRTRTIARREFSHILTPRDGWPIEDGLASVVIAKDALTADAIATALSVQTLSSAIEWVDSLKDVEALVVDNDGRQMSSANWHSYIDKSMQPATQTSAKLQLEYTLPKFTAANYNRPYLAIWVSDTKQKPLKNLLLLGESERWARKNTRWWRRVGRKSPQLLDGVARATRGAGEYQLQWNGIDDYGQLIAAGDYLLHIEASREGGGSNYHKIPFSFGKENFSKHLDAKGELGNIQLEIANND